jgi:hypothetical protein
VSARGACICDQVVRGQFLLGRRCRIRRGARHQPSLAWTRTNWTKEGGDRNSRAAEVEPLQVTPRDDMLAVLDLVVGNSKPNHTDRLLGRGQRVWRVGRRGVGEKIFTFLAETLPKLGFSVLP